MARSARGTPPRGNQPTARREWGYSRGWRLFTVIILRPLLRLLIRYQWQGQENFPKTGGVILAPNHLSYADWPTIALFSDAYGHRFPVFMIKSGIFEVKLIGPLLYKVGQLPVYRGRGDAGLVLKQAEQALRGGRVRDRLPGGHRHPRPGPVADGGQDRRGPAGAEHRGAGDPDRALGRAGHPPVRDQEAPPVAAQDGPDGRRAAGGPVGLRRAAAGRIDAAGRDRRHHGRHHRPAGQDQAADAARRALGSRRRRSACCYGPNGRWCSGPGRCLRAEGAADPPDAPTPARHEAPA